MAKNIRLNPAGAILGIIGIANASKITSVDRVQVWRWTQPKSSKGTGGLIPQAHHDSLLSYAEEHGLPVTAAMFIRRHKPKPKARRKPAKAAGGSRSASQF